MLALRGLGLSVLVPLGENTCYDLVIDDGSSFARVQCKTGRLRSGAVRWSMCSNYAHHPNPQVRQRDYQGEVDFFGVYCPETAGVYLIPISDLPIRRKGALRVEEPRNGQRKFIRYAHHFEIGQVRLTPREEPGATSGA